MERALELAAIADYRTSPNPMVGAVVLDAAGEIAGDGFHEAAGSPHAEALALASAGPKASGGTLYVTLEPCTHHGRTPPCAEAVIAAGVRRVVVAMRDPDSRVSGRGVARLREAGIEVAEGPGEEAARRLNEFYVTQRTTGRPFVTLKWAMSLDGKIATSIGESRWISGEESRRHAHLLRHRHDAILVGVNTVLEDDPQLTSRLEDLRDPRQPLRVVADSMLRTPPDAKVLPALIVAAEEAPDDRREALEQAGAEVVRSGTAPEPLLDLLGSRGVLSLLVEGGARTHWSFVQRGLADRVTAYVAPIIIGGEDAPGPVGGTGFTGLKDALRLDDPRVTRLGNDYLIEADVHRDR